MPAELTLETLAKDITDLKTLAAGIKVGMEEDDHKKMEAKKAMDEEHEKEKMEARHAKRDAAIRLAMEMDDEEKKDAALKKAMEEHCPNKKHEGMDEPHPKTEKEAMDEEHTKEKDAQIASIINEKKNSLIKQILTANRVINPATIKDVEARLKKASITQIENEWNIVKPFIVGADPESYTVPQQPIIPFYANMTPADIDANQLTASSPDSDFTKLSTKELLEGNQ